MRPTLKTVSLTLCFAGLYFMSWHVAFEAGLLHLSISGATAAVGVAVGMSVMFGWPVVVGIIVGGMAAGLSVGEPLDVAALVAVVTAGQGVIAMLALRSRRINFDPGMRTIADVVVFVALGAFLPSIVGALVGIPGLIVEGHLGPGSVAGAFRNWWLVDFARILVSATPVLILVSYHGRHPGAARSTVRVAVAALAAAGVSLWLLRGHGGINYLVLGLLVILALVYRQRGAALGSLLIGVVTVALTAHGHGPFVGGGEDEALLRAGTFVAVGSITALLVAAALSEREAARTAMRRLVESERALAEAQSVGDIGSFVVDLATFESVWSDQLYKILGRRRDDDQSSWLVWRDRVADEDRDRVDAFTKHLYDECGEGSHSHRIVRMDGQVRWVEVKLRYERDEPNGPPTRVRGTCQDITAFKLADDRIRVLFERAPYPMLVLDTCGTIVETNVRAHDLFGVESELVGESIEQYVLEPDNTRTLWYLTDEGTDLELRGCRHDGTDFPLEVFATPLRTEAGPLVLVGLRDVTEIREASEALEFQARHDGLTGLPNRTKFGELLNHALMRARLSGSTLGVLFLDLDDFKVVNDTRGHDIGDLLLRALAPRLEAAVRHGDVVARLAGDEFVVLCENLQGDDEARLVAERLVSVAARQPFELAGRAHRVTLSAGIVTISGREAAARSAEQILRDADSAMYSAKAAGKDQVASFDQTSPLRFWDRSPAA